MPRVLVVDDAAFMRMSIKNILERNGYEIAGEAENGIMAVQKYKECHPDIVTMDITMPEMDGVEALKRIKEIDPEAKIIMLSAMGQADHVKEAILSGAKNFIVKPFDEEHMMKALSNL